MMMFKMYGTILITYLKNKLIENKKATNFC